MKPQSSLKKFLLPAVILIAVIIVGAFVFMRGGAVDQGAALFNAATKTSSFRTPVPTILDCPMIIGSNGIPVVSAPSIRVISPNGGEVYQPGQQVTVKWKVCPNGNPINPAALTYIWLESQPGSSNEQRYPLLSASAQILFNSGQAVITVPPNLPNYPNMPLGTNFKIMVGDWHYGGGPDIGNDESDNLFTINTPAITH